MMNQLDNEKLVTVAERFTEVAAQILVNVLEDEGIRAITTGAAVAGFRAEAPGYVSVKTMESDAEAARKIIAEVKQDDHDSTEG